MEFVIIKKIRVEADTLEEALLNHEKGSTFSITADRVVGNRPTRPLQKIGPSLRNPPQ